MKPAATTTKTAFSFNSPPFLNHVQSEEEAQAEEANAELRRPQVGVAKPCGRAGGDVVRGYSLGGILLGLGEGFPQLGGPVQQ